MRSSNVLFSAVHFFVVLFLISLGLFFVVLPYADAFRLRVTHFIYQEPEIFEAVGFSIFGFGLLLLIGFYMLNRRRFLQIKMGPAETLVDQTIVHDYVQKYWKKMHPAEDPNVDVVIQKGEILEIIVPAPKNWEGEVEKHLMQVQNDLRDQLSRRLGYYREFYLTLSDS